MTRDSYVSGRNFPYANGNLAPGIRNNLIVLCQGRTAIVVTSIPYFSFNKILLSIRFGYSSFQFATNSIFVFCDVCFVYVFAVCRHFTCVNVESVDKWKKYTISRPFVAVVQFYLFHSRYSNLE